MGCTCCKADKDDGTPDERTSLLAGSKSQPSVQNSADSEKPSSAVSREPPCSEQGDEKNGQETDATDNTRIKNENTKLKETLEQTASEIKHPKDEAKKPDETHPITVDQQDDNMKTSKEPLVPMEEERRSLSDAAPELTTKNDSLEEQLAGQERETGELDESTAQHEEKMTKPDQEVKVLREQATKAGEENQSLPEQATTTEEEVLKSKEEARQLKEVATTRDESTKALEDSVAKLEEEREKLEGQNAELEEEKESLNEQVTIEGTSDETNE